MDFSKIRAQGPWVFVEVLQPPRENGLTKSASGLLYLPDGNMEERMGLAKARVISVGKGIWDEEKQVLETPGFGPGEIIVFRGFLKEANKPSFLNDDYCFIHLQDVLGIWVPDLPRSATVVVSEFVAQ